MKEANLKKMIIDGKKIAKIWYQQLTEEIKRTKAHPVLCAFLIGNNASSMRYLKQKKKWAQRLGIEFILEHLEEDVSQWFLLKKIEGVNENPAIHWCMIQLPLPANFDVRKVLESVVPHKDVDGFHPLNQGKIVINDQSGFVPCTPAGIMHIFEHLQIDLQGKNMVVIWKSNIVGKPLVNLLMNQGATVTSCNSHTKNLKQFTQQAEIVILATGKIGLLQADMLWKKTVVIDVGFTVKNGSISWDAEFESIKKAGHDITPVPGWVWAMTVLYLMKNTLKAYENRKK